MPSDVTHTGVALIVRRAGESWETLHDRLEQAQGSHVLLVLSPQDGQELHGLPESSRFLQRCERMRDRLIVATRRKALAEGCRGRGIRVITKSQELHELLEGHAQIEEGLRTFSPHLWQRELRSRLQSMGLLTVPKLRIWVLIGTSVLLFLFVLFKLLPSAEVKVWPRQDTVSQTVNVYLVQSGATIPAPPTVRRALLEPIVVELNRSITFDRIHREFTGKRAQVLMTVYNETPEDASLIKGSRLVTGTGGIIFFLTKDIVVPAHSKVTVRADAADEDQLGDIIGQRGNVPANLRWDFIGLSAAERQKLYAKNLEPGKGGTTASRLVLRQRDIEEGFKQLQRELVATAKQIVEDRVFLLNQTHADGRYQTFADSSLTLAIFHDINLPTEFLNETVTSVPFEGNLTYTAVAYDAVQILAMLSDDLKSHAEEGKAIVEDTIGLPGLRIYVIEWGDDLSWVKITAELTGTERYVLDPLTVQGAAFGKRVRESIAGLRRDDALKVVKNMPEVERVEIRTWPPWARTLTGIPANITMTAE